MPTYFITQFAVTVSGLPLLDVKIFTFHLQFGRGIFINYLFRRKSKQQNR